MAIIVIFVAVIFVAIILSWFVAIIPMAVIVCGHHYCRPQGNVFAAVPQVTRGLIPVI